VADPSFREQLIKLLHNPTPETLDTLGLPELAARVRRDPTWWRRALHKAEVKLPTAEPLRLPPEAQQQVDRTLAQLARMERAYLATEPVRQQKQAPSPPTRAPPRPTPAKRPSNAGVAAAVKNLGPLPEGKLWEAIKVDHPGARRQQVRDAIKDLFGSRPAHRPFKN
jgi:hypothetical protein